MIKYTFSAEGFEKTDKLQKYVEQKVKDIEKYIPRHARQSAQLSIRIAKTPKSKTESYTCSVSLTLPHQKLLASEKVEHSYAALDVVMAEIKRQVADYKSKHARQSLRHKAANFIRRHRGKTPPEIDELSDPDQ